MSITSYRTVDVDGYEVFYREAGDRSKPTLLLLHGFPTSSHMFRNLLPLLADRFHLVAPDLPGFGRSALPPREAFHYSFAKLADVITRFSEVVGLDRFALYIFDYGAPVGLRLASKHPERITAIISQNGNAYEEGLSDGWNPIQRYWRDPNDRQSAGSARAALARFDPVAVRAWRARPRPALAGRLRAGRLVHPAAGCRRHPTRPVRRLCEQRGPLPQLPGLFPRAQAAPSRDLGQERPVLPAGRRGSLPARPAECGGPLRRYRPFRARETHVEEIAAAIGMFLSR